MDISMVIWFLYCRGWFHMETIVVCTECDLEEERIDVLDGILYTSKKFHSISILTDFSKRIGSRTGLKILLFK